MSRSLEPPWKSDASPDAWMKLGDAARIYFRKHPTYLRLLASRGELPGAVRYGREWYVRLPDDYCATIRNREQ